MGASSSTKAAAEREKMHKIVSNLRSVAEPLTFIVDQGGGSFRAYIYSGLTQVIRIKSVNAWEKLMDKSTLAAYTENIGSDLINPADGTFNDYSSASPEHYRYICDCLAASYKNAFVELCNMTKIAPGSITTKKIVRQTGKIRTVLHEQKEQGNSTNFDKWNSEFKTRLGADYDYKLLSNQDEAMLESCAFFELNDHVANDSYIGVGMGSSSTQVYGNSSKGHYCLFNSFCGVKASKDKPTKEVSEWVNDFSALFKPIFRVKKQNTIVLLNAIGYIFIKTTLPDYEGKEEFMAQLKAAEKIKPPDLLKWITAYAAAVEGDSEHAWSSNLLLALAQTLASIPQCKWVYCERKGPVGESLNFSTSWSKYLILKRLRAKIRQEATIKAPSGRYTKEEREGYKQQIRKLQTYIIGNATRVLSLKQVQALSCDQWDKKILAGGKTPQQRFQELKNEDGVITQDQWEENYSAIASLRNSETPVESAPATTTTAAAWADS